MLASSSAFHSQTEADRSIRLSECGCLTSVPYVFAKLPCMVSIHHDSAYNPTIVHAVLQFIVVSPGSDAFSRCNLPLPVTHPVSRSPILSPCLSVPSCGLSLASLTCSGLPTYSHARLLIHSLGQSHTLTHTFAIFSTRTHAQCPHICNGIAWATQILFR